jgi:hypothetical protein
MGTTPGSAEQRFPGYEVTGQANSWDKTTAAVVLQRLSPAGAPVFFSHEEEPIARALISRLLAQDDDPMVPVFEMIDRRLAERRGDGYRYEDLPDDPEAWQHSVAAVEAEASGRYQQSFADLPLSAQVQIIEAVRICPGDWRGLPAKRIFALWMRYACTAFYSHPWAWNEIGFGGPAYPRGYKNLGFDRREPWEFAERDAQDPVPWGERAEAAKSRHAQYLETPQSDATTQAST